MVMVTGGASSLKKLVPLICKGSSGTYGGRAEHQWRAC